MARSWPLRPRCLHAGFWPCERVMVSASHLLLTLALALQNSLAKKGQPLDFLIHVTGLLLFSRERKSHMDEFVHVAVNCKWNTHGHHGYKPDWLVSMRYKPLSEIAVIIRMIKLCCFDSIHDQHSFMQRCSLWLVSKRILIFSSCQHKQKTYIRLFQFLYGEECQRTLL